MKTSSQLYWHTKSDTLSHAMELHSCRGSFSSRHRFRSQRDFRQRKRGKISSRRLGISFGVDASFLRYSRDQELEANLMALRMLSSAKYDPNALAVILDAVSQAAFVFNHPYSENVLEDMDVEIERIAAPAARPAHATPEFRNLQASLQKIVYPVVEKEPDEAVASDATSSIFTHPMDFYRLGYPAGWLVTRTGPNGAIIAPADGVQSSRAGDDVTHGVMLDLFDLSVADRALTLDQATNRLIVYLRQNNQSLRIVPGAQRQTLISDEPGLRTVMIGKSVASNSSEVVWVVTRLYYQSLFYMVFVAPEDEFPILRTHLRTDDSKHPADGK